MKKLRMSKAGIIVRNSLRCGDGEGDDGGTGGEENTNNASIDVNSSAFKNAVAAAATELSSKDTDGLKNKNSDLIDRLQKANDKAKQFDGMDLEKIRTMTKIFEQSEEAQLISEGKFEEVMQKRTDKVTAGFHDQVTQLTNELTSSKENEILYKTRLDQNAIRDSLTKAALKSGVRKDAIDDIVRRGFDTFSVNEAGEIESRDKNGDLIQTEEKLLLNPERFVDTLKSSNPYYWNASESGETFGSNDKHGGQNIDSIVEGAASSEKFDLDTYRKARTKQSGENYHQRSR